MLRKVVVFDCGFGGDAFAERLEREVAVLDVIRVIDWRHAPYCQRSEAEIRQLTEIALARYIGRVDAIVLASYEVTVAALKFLRMRHPEQVFVGMSWPVVRQEDLEKMVVLTTNLVRKSRAFRRTRRRWTEQTAVQLCDKLVQAVDDGEVDEQEIKRKTVRTRRLRPKFVVLGCTNLVDVRREIEMAYTGACVLDGYGMTVRQVCKILGIKGARGDPG